MDKVGFKFEGIFVMDVSKRDGCLNVYFGGLGKNKWVVLFDILIFKVGIEGFLVILGYELGYFKNKDLLKSLGIMGGLFVFVFVLIVYLLLIVFEGFNVL